MKFFKKLAALFSGVLTLAACTMPNSFAKEIRKVKVPVFTYSQERFNKILENTNKEYPNLQVEIEMLGKIYNYQFEFQIIPYKLGCSAKEMEEYMKSFDIRWKLSACRYCMLHTDWNYFEGTAKTFENQKENLWETAYKPWLYAAQEINSHMTCPVLLDGTDELRDDTDRLNLLANFISPICENRYFEDYKDCGYDHGQCVSAINVEKNSSIDLAYIAELAYKGVPCITRIPPLYKEMAIGGGALVGTAIAGGAALYNKVFNRNKTQKDQTKDLKAPTPQKVNSNDDTKNNPNT